METLIAIILVCLLAYGFIGANLYLLLCFVMGEEYRTRELIKWTAIGIPAVIRMVTRKPRI